MDETDSRIQRILSNTFTKSDCYTRLLLLQDFLSHALYRDAAHARPYAELLKERYVDSAESAQAEAVAEWGEDFLRSFKVQDDDSVEALKRRIAEMPDLLLYVPVVLGPTELRPIAAWCRTNVDQRVFLELIVDTSAAGGCMIVWKSVLYDFSLRYFMRKHETELAQMVERVVVTPGISPAAA